MALLIVAPLVLPEFWRRFLTEILIWGLLAMSSDILIGYTGMVSFGHSAFFGLGMYGAAAALLDVRAAQSLARDRSTGWSAPPRSRLFVAYFSTRLRDIYFAITTLIFSQIFYVIIFTWTEVTGGENGLTFSRPALGIPGLSARCRSPPTTLHWFVLAVVTASYLILRRITQSPFGMVLQSIRENEPRTRAIGYPVERYKIVAVMLSGLFAGLAGVLYAIQNRFAAPDFVYFLISGEAVIFNVMGGIGTLVGPIVGAGFFLLLREAFSRFFGTEYLSHPGRGHLHRDGHLHAAGAAGLHAALAQPVSFESAVEPRVPGAAQHEAKRNGALHPGHEAPEVVGPAALEAAGFAGSPVPGSDRKWAASMRLLPFALPCGVAAARQLIGSL